MNSIEEFEGAVLYEENYIVEKIMDKKTHNGVVKYKVKWLGYPTSQCTWEPLENLDNCLELVDEYQSRLSKKNDEISKPNKKQKIENFTDSIRNNELKSLDDLSNSNISIDKNKPNNETKTNFDCKQTEVIKGKLILDDGEVGRKNFNQVAPKSDESLKEGNFDEFQADRIVDAMIVFKDTVEFKCLVSWKTNKEGLIPKNSYVSSNTIRKRDPELLLKFYESKMKFPPLKN